MGGGDALYYTVKELLRWLAEIDARRAKPPYSNKVEERVSGYKTPPKNDDYS